MTLSTALEQIFYQNKDSFVDSAQGLIEGIYKEIDDNGYKSDKDILTQSKKLNGLNTLIKNRFGLNCEITRNRLYTGNLAAVYTPVSVQMVDYTLFDLAYVHNRELRAYLEKSTSMLLSQEAKKSIVNFKLAKISGYYSKIAININIDFYSLYKEIKLSAREIVAVLLHEIGHVFVGFSYHYRVNQLNLNTAVVVDALNANNVQEAVYVLNNDIKSQDDYLSMKSNTEVRHDIAFAVLARYVDLSKEYRYLYSMSNNESMADNFATRFNVGRELVSSLEMMNVYFHELYGVSDSMKGMRDKREHDFNQSMQAIFVGMCDIFGVVATKARVDFIEPLLFLFTVSIKTNLYTYDNNYTRYKRIKIAIIDNLKTISHDPKLQKELLSQIDYIEEQLDKYKDKQEFDGVMTFILSLFIPKYHEGVRFKKLQNTIEEFLNSDLTHLTLKLGEST